MKLLTFMTISLIFTIVCSTKCKKPERKCIKLCCSIEKIYIEESNMCHQIPDQYVQSWYDLLGNKITRDKVEVVERGKCETSADSIASSSAFLDSCLSAAYGDSNQLFLKEYFMVPCNRSPPHMDVVYTAGKPATQIGAQIGMFVFVSLSILAPLILLFTCVRTRKAKEDNLSFKLVSWYLMSMLATTLSLVFQIFMPLKIFGSSNMIYILLPEFFYTSTTLWLSAIGYEIWIGFKESNRERNTATVRKRFIWYSIYVWGITTTIYVPLAIHYEIEFGSTDWTNLITLGPVYFIAYFNVIAYFVLSFKICLIRYRVARITTEKDFIYNIIRIIMRLGLMMGIPRMFLIMLATRPYIGVPITIMCFLEPYLVFIAFVADEENCCSVFLCSRCCRSRCYGQEESKTTNSILIRSTTV